MAKRNLDTPPSNAKYRQLVAAIHEQVDAGQLKVGDRLPPERQLADEFGFSRVTVRAALKELHRCGLVTRIQGKGTFIADPAQRSPRIRTAPGAVCLVFRQDPAENPWYEPVFRGFRETLSRQNLHLHINVIGAEDPLALYSGEKALSPSTWNGLAFLCYQLDDDDIAHLRQQNIPFVCFGPPRAGEKVSYVDVDNVSGGYQATRYLLDQGRSRIAFLGEALDDWANADRYKGYCRALAENDLTVNPNLRHEVHPMSEDLGAKAIDAILQDHNIDGVVVRADWATVGAVRALRRHGLRVPEEVGVVMYDDIPWVAKMLVPALASIRQPFYELGTHAAELLLDQINNPEAGAQIRLLQPTLVIRAGMVNESDGRARVT